MMDGQGPRIGRRYGLEEDGRKVDLNRRSGQEDRVPSHSRNAISEDDHSSKRVSTNARTEMQMTILSQMFIISICAMFALFDPSSHSAEHSVTSDSRKASLDRCNESRDGRRWSDL
jgi:hypothetical protein